MIKLKDLLYEMSSLNLLIPRRVEGRMEKYIQTKAKEYIKNKNVGDFDISGLKLTTLPALLKNLKIGGSFDCRYNKLTSLVGAPTGVGGSFYCSDNNLKSLVGAPTSVGGDFLCNNNKLTSLVGAPVSVGGYFHCRYNKLTSLVGAPVSVGGYFLCSYNKLKSLVGAPTSVGLDFDCNNNVVKFTEEQVRAVCDVKGKINV
jgi:hypothetical protein